MAERPANDAPYRLIDDVDFGDNVVVQSFTNPHATTAAGEMQTESDWELLRTLVERRASLGSGAVILGGITIGAAAIVGAGAVVTRDVEAAATVTGNPGKPRSSSRCSP